MDTSGNITYQVEGKTRTGTEIDSNYNIYALYSDGTKLHLGEVCIPGLYFFVENNEGEILGTTSLELYVGTADEETGLIEGTPTKYQGNEKTGYLCNKDGYCLLGWDGDMQGNMQYLNLEYEPEGKERTGTEIKTDGKIYAVFSDNTKELIKEIPVELIPNAPKLEKTRENLYLIAGNEKSGYSDFIGEPITRHNLNFTRMQ